MAEMDQLIQELQEARAKYEELKRISTEAYHQLEEVERKVIGALTYNNRTKYQVEGIGTVYLSHKETWSVPKSVDDKRKLFKYIADKHGVDALDAMLSIHHVTLNSFAKKETESGQMQIPGLAEPTATVTLNFRRG
jgi:hypothetical protein